MTPREQAAALAPDYFKRERRQARRFYGSLAVAIVAIAGATWAAVETHSNAADITNVHREVTKVEHSPCIRAIENPTNKKAIAGCEVIRQKLALTENLKAGCITHQRIEGTMGLNCPRWYVNHSENGAPEAFTKGVVPSSSKGHSQPGPN